MTEKKQHPQLPTEKIGVLLLNLGTPDATDYWSIRRYLSEFLSDKRVIDYPKWLWQPLLQGVILMRRPFISGHAYKKIWNTARNESPLKTHTRAQCEKLQSVLGEQHDSIVVVWGMRYGNPSTAMALQSLLDQGCRKILFMAMYPQYSAVTVATAYDKAFDALRTVKWQPAIRTVTPWCDDTAYIDVLANSIQQHLQGLDQSPDYLLTSFHGLPKRYLQQGDPYSCFCAKTSRLLRERLGWDEARWQMTFQSRFGGEKWLQPYTDVVVKELAQQGVKHLAVVSPAFVCDCIETLEEINIALRKTFLAHGGERFTYIPCLNDSNAHITFLADKIKHELQGWLTERPI